MVQLLLEVPKLSQNIELTSSETSPFNQEVSFNKVSRLFWVFSAFVLLQIIFGGFMAGTHAAKLYHTFPDMNGDMVPSGMFSESPWIANFSENQTTIQFVHRWLGVAVLFVASLLWAKSRKLSRSPLKTGITMMEIAVAVQVVLGIFTLLLSPPAKVSVGLGVLHQGLSLIHI